MGSQYHHSALANPSGLLALAMAIADDNVRGEIELYARQHWIEDTVFYDTAQVVEPGEEAEQDLAVVQRALQYIEARGDVWPWRLKRHINNPALIHFDDTNAEVPA